MYRIDEIFIEETVPSAIDTLHMLRSDEKTTQAYAHPDCFTPLGLSVMAMLGCAEIDSAYRRYKIPRDIYLSLFAEEP